ITDFEPGNETKKTISRIKTKLNIPFYQADAHNICPIFETSNKQEYAARTIRPKIKSIISTYFTQFSEIKKMPRAEFYQNNWDSLEQKITVDKRVPTINWLKPGENAAKTMLKDFVENKLDFYDEKRNDPTLDATSNLSPYLTFGHISAQKVALEVIKSKAKKHNKEAFLEELIVRKELSDNFCHYNENYDNVKSFDSWAISSLKEHENDFRQYIYTLEEFENATTHDYLWNAAQIEMVKKGKMHGYMRMYWAKKILEWTKNAQTAMKYANYLNDKYELDGLCPNGYVGIAWSIGGVHDRAWNEREIFGKIRYMSYNGCKSKFDVDKYVKQVALIK
ncbi:MAG: hypothetical protein PHV68_10500, partial [Candidatus Gastranaerophilales bacterium]|nr:hypothetical protein [Candidatus Gastranaerophilales bacterium]